MDSAARDTTPARRWDDGGRTILEALIGLALVGLAVLGWSRMATATTRAEAAATHRTAALELASNAVDSLVARDWADAAIDPDQPGAVRRFEGRDVVLGPGGAAGEESVSREGRSFTVRRYVLDSGDPAWRRIVVTVAWAEGEVEYDVRVDSAVRAPDPGGA